MNNELKESTMNRYAEKIISVQEAFIKHMNEQSKAAADILMLNEVISKRKHDRLIKKIDKMYKEKNK